MYTVQQADADMVLYTLKASERVIKIVQVCRADALPTEEYGTAGYVAFAGFVQLDDPSVEAAIAGMDYVHTARGLAYFDGAPIADFGTDVYTACVAEALWHHGAQSDVREQAGTCALSLAAWAMAEKLSCEE